MEVFAFAAISCVCVASIAAVVCFKVKYGGTREIDRLSKQIAHLNTRIEGEDAEAVKDLKSDVAVLRNHYGLTSRRQV